MHKFIYNTCETAILNYKACRTWYCVKNNVMNQSLTLTRRVNKLKDKYYNMTLHRGLSLSRILKRQSTKWSQLSE